MNAVATLPRGSAQVMAVARWEFRASVRSRWVLVMAATFTVLAVTVTVLGFRTVRELGLTGIGPAAASLVNLGVLVPSLMGILLGAGSLVGARDGGLLSMLAAQPLNRSALVVGSLLGQSAALCATLSIGLGSSLVVMSGVVGARDVPALALFFVATVGVAVSAVAIGLFICTIASTRSQAFAGAVALWIMLALGVDLGLAALAPSVRLGPLALLVAVWVDPLEAGRLLALLGTNLKGTALGPFGAYLTGSFGTWGAVGMLAASLVAWITLPTALACLAMRVRDAA